MKRAIDYIETHLADKITAVDLAGLACSMMRTTREPLSQVAVACGLCDQAHLCKRHTVAREGEAPGGIRRRRRERTQRSRQLGNYKCVAFVQSQTA
jgi:hypothetical protein